MKKTIFIIAILSTLSLFSTETKLVKRYAILVGANNGGDGRVILRYAESDAKMVSNVFSELGGIENSNSILLLNPTKRSIKKSFNKITDYIENDRKNTRTELIFYYSGHSDETGLLVRNDHFSYKDLKKALEGTNANVKIGILDSCSSGAFTNLKGGTHTAPFLIDESVKTTGHAYITSAAEDESAQESNTLKASFFTHYLVSALRGAGDKSLDGIVSLHEAYSYASNETLARTESTQAGAQHASYDFRLKGSGDIVLTDLRRSNSSISFSKNDYGRLFIRDKHDNLISEVNKKRGSALSISIPASSYYIVRELNGQFSNQRIILNPGETKQILTSKYTSFKPERNTERGSSLTNRNIDVPKITAFMRWTTMDRIRSSSLDIDLLAKAGSLNGVQVSLGNSVVNSADGIQVGALFNIVGEHFSGTQVSALQNIIGGRAENYTVQASGLYNWVGLGSDELLVQGSGLFNYLGGNASDLVIQGAGLFNSSGDISGVQISGLFNKSLNISGVQIAGLFNVANDVNGIQLTTLLNRSLDIHGIQLSLINVADYVYGTQIGLININKDVKGATIGLINISTRGLHNFSYRYNTTNKEHYIDYQFGSSTFYNLFYVGIPEDTSVIERFNLGIGGGIHIKLGSIFTELELSVNNKLNYINEYEFEYLSSHPLIGIKLGIPLWDNAAIFLGTSLEFPNADGLKSTYDFTDYSQSFYAGVRI
ncbi:MAG: hypothetical protein B6229_06130 [Spirochaetaceae bacterium 4572_7]|nr:MAG: hypothetical protein B6229_06130 [Spirochaetaceae bacterium 4572_7]